MDNTQEKQNLGLARIERQRRTGRRFVRKSIARCVITTFAASAKRAAPNAATDSNGPTSSRDASTTPISSSTHGVDASKRF